MASGISWITYSIAPAHGPFGVSPLPAQKYGLAGNVPTPALGSNVSSLFSSIVGICEPSTADAAVIWMPMPPSANLRAAATPLPASNCTSSTWRSNEGPPAASMSLTASSKPFSPSWPKLAVVPLSVSDAPISIVWPARGLGPSAANSSVIASPPEPPVVVPGEVLAGPAVVAGAAVVADACVVGADVLSLSSSSLPQAAASSDSAATEPTMMRRRRDLVLALVNMTLSCSGERCRRRIVARSHVAVIKNDS